MKKINVSLSVEEINVLLNALGQLPYAQVFGLVESLRQQANEQLHSKDEPVVSANGVGKHA